MDATTTSNGIELRRHRLATNDNETIVEDRADDQDVEGHRLAANDSEIVVEGVQGDAGDDSDELDAFGPSRLSNHGH